MSYIQQQLEKLNPEAAEYFQLKLGSVSGETFWFTISPEALKEIEAILEKEYQP